MSHFNPGNELIFITVLLALMYLMIPIFVIRQMRQNRKDKEKLPVSKDIEVMKEEFSVPKWVQTFLFSNWRFIGYWLILFVLFQYKTNGKVWLNLSYFSLILIVICELFWFLFRFLLGGIPYKLFFDLEGGYIEFTLSLNNKIKRVDFNGFTKISFAGNGHFDFHCKDGKEYGWRNVDISDDVRFQSMIRKIPGEFKVLQADKGTWCLIPQSKGGHDND